MRGLAIGLVFLVLAAAVIALLLQTTLFHVLPFGSMIPDLVLILCVYLGLHQQTFAGSSGAFLLGYFTDSVSGNAVGLHAFAMSLVFLFVFLISRRLWMDNVFANVTVVFVAGMLKAVTITMLLAFYLSVDVPWDELATKIFLEALLAALFAPLIFLVLDGGRRSWGID